jgi:hypothetical protein
MCIATQREKNNDPLAIMAFRDMKLLTGQCVKTGRIHEFSCGRGGIEGGRHYLLTRQLLAKSRRLRP